MKFAALGLNAEYVGMAEDDSEVVKRVLSGDIQLPFISPESILNNKRFRNMLLLQHYKDKLVAVAVDEAHCIKTWWVFCVVVIEFKLSLLYPTIYHN